MRIQCPKHGEVEALVFRKGVICCSKCHAKPGNMAVRQGGSADLVLSLGESEPQTSMGCKVETPTCVLCEKPDIQIWKNRAEGVKPIFSEAVQRVALAMEGVQDSDGKPTFFSCSFVGPSQCDICGKVMEPDSSSTWQCVTKGCPQNGIPVVTGVYPAIPVTPKKE